MVHVIVTMRIKEGRMPEFLAACRDLRPRVLQEAGCLAYTYTRDSAAPGGDQPVLEADRVTLIECWEPMAALKAHLGTAHMREAGERMKDLRSSVELRFTEAIF